MPRSVFKSASGHSVCWKTYNEPWIKGRPLLQGVPFFKTIHRTVLKFTPCGAHSVGRSRRCGDDQGLCPNYQLADSVSCKPFWGKGLTPNLFNFFLYWQAVMPRSVFNNASGHCVFILFNAVGWNLWCPLLSPTGGIQDKAASWGLWVSSLWLRGDVTETVLYHSAASCTLSSGYMRRLCWG